MGFEDYIYGGELIHKNTSEANILGAYAHRFMPDSCVFIDALDTERNPPPKNGWAYPIAQAWSHGGLDRPGEWCAVLPGGGNTAGRTPRSVINQVLYGITS